MLMNELNFASGAIRCARFRAGEDRIASSVGLTLATAGRGRRAVCLDTLSAGQAVTVVIFSIDIVIVVVVVLVGRTGIFLATFLLDAVVSPVAAALPRTLDPVAGRRRKIVRIALAEFVCWVIQKIGN